MDESTRRTVLATATILALATLAFAGGGYTFGLLTDEERAGASIRAASDFDGAPSADELVSFRGCGALWLHVPEDASFALSVTLSDSVGNTGRTVTLTDADAGPEDSGFWYSHGQDRYQFDLAEYRESSGEAGIVSAELDGEPVANDNQCAAVETGEAGARSGTGSSTVTTTAGNAASETVTPSQTGDTDGDAAGAGDDADDPDESETSATTTGATTTATETATTATTVATTTEATTTATTASPTTTARHTTEPPHTTEDSPDSSGDATSVESTSAPDTTTETEGAAKTASAGTTTTAGTKTTAGTTTGEAS